MKYRITRMASLVLAFGIFFIVSCGNLKNTDRESSSDETSLQNELTEINRKISENPDKSDLQVEKASLLYRYSQTIPIITDRQPIYQNLRDLADGYEARFTNSSDSLDKILEKAWREEQNNGIKLLHQNDQEEITDEEFPTAISHFENAITTIPDSLQTYGLLSTTYYKQGNLSQAIETLEKADQHAEGENTDIQEKMAYLYLESGKLDEAENKYRNLAASHPDNLLYKHGFVNVLILNDQHQEAIELLKDLSDEYPNRYNYQESLATELYYLFRDRTSQYIDDGNNVSLDEEDQQELTDMLNSVHSLFESLQETLPTSEENLYRMATFYKRTSQRLEQLSAKSDLSFSDLQTEFMEYSLPLWEQLSELKPKNLGYISNLHDVYLKLGMNEEATSLERSYNF